MTIQFELLNEDMIIIGMSRLNLPTEDVEAAILGLRATGEAYTQCRWLKYDIYWQDNGPQECHGKMYIQPCQKDS